MFLIVFLFHLLYYHYIRYCQLQLISYTYVCLSVVNARMPCNLKTLLSIGRKRKVLKSVKSGRMKKDIDEEFGIPASTLFTIIKNLRK